METLSIEIKNPKVKQLLKDLAEMNLITIRPANSLKSALVNLRKNADKVPTLEEITDEVKQVRKARNASTT